MKKVMIGLGVVVLVMVVAAIGGVIYLSSSLDSLVAAAIEKYGTEAVGSRVQVDSVELALRDGRGTIRGFRIANPEGYSDADAFALSELTLKLDVESLTGEPIVVEEIGFGETSVLFEMDANGRSNFDAIRENVARNRGPSRDPEPSEAAEEDASSEDQPRLRIALLAIKEGTIRTNLTAVGRGESETTLPPFTLKDIGGASGARPNELAGQITQSVTRQVVATVMRDRLGAGMRERIAEQVKKLREESGGELPPEAENLLRSFTGGGTGSP